MTPKSYLYVPGNDAQRLERAFSRGADALIADLEDAVPGPVKQAARETTRSWLATPSADRGATQIWLRINPGDTGHLDLRAVLDATTIAHVDGIIVAKTQTRDELDTIDRILTDLEQQAGAESGSVGVVPLLESAAALFEARAIAAGPRVRRLQLGEADLSADLGVTAGADGRELLYARSALVAAGAAAGLEPPIAPAPTNFRDLEALETSTQALARLGFYGRSCIHPAQIPVVHTVFSPTPEQIDDAQRLVARFDQTLEGSQGVFVAEDGSMVDEAVVRSARRTLARAGLL